MQNDFQTVQCPSYFEKILSEAGFMYAKFSQDELAKITEFEQDSE